MGLLLIYFLLRDMTEIQQVCMIQYINQMSDP
nr:MAG TPA: hypothetical protein [Bacteriophage sp.]